MKNIIKKVVKLALWVGGCILALLLLLIVLIQLPFIQNKIKDVAIGFVHNKIGTPISLERISIAFPKQIVIDGLYIESQQKDTLLYTKYLGVDIGFFKLLGNTVEISNIDLEGLTTTVKRDSLQGFNFDYIVNAFASDTPEEPSESKPMDIQLGDVNLKDIKVNFQDDYQGHHLKMELADLLAKVKDIDLEKEHYGLSKIAVDGLKIDYQKSPSLEAEALPEAQDSLAIKTSDTLPSLDLGIISLSNFDITYKDQESKLQAALVMKQLEVDFHRIDLNTQQIEIDNVLWNNTYIKALFLENNLPLTLDVQKQTSSQEVVDTKVDSISSTLPWQISVKQISVGSIGVDFDDENFKAQNSGLDPYHIGISDLGVQVKDFQFSGSTITANIKDFAFKEKSGFVLENFSTYLLYDKQTSFIKDFYLKTPNTKITSSIVLNYQDINTIEKQLDKISVDASILDSYIGFKDIDLLLPGVLPSDQIKGIQQDKISFDVIAKGKVADLNIERFFVRALGSTFINANAKVKNLPDVSKAYMELNLKDLQTTNKDIAKVVDKSLLPANMQIPALIKLQGFVKGSMQNATTDLKLTSSLGNLSLKGLLDQRAKNKESYSLDVEVDQLQLGQLIGNDSIGMVNLYLGAKGQGLDVNTAKASFEMDLKDAHFNGYTYKDAVIKGELDQGAYQVNWNNTDPNLLVDLSAKGQVSDSAISLDLLADLKNIDFNKLKLDSEPRVLTTTIKANMPNILPDSLVGTLRIEDLGFVLQDRAYTLQPIVFTALAQPGQRQMSLTSQLIDFNLSGDYVLTDLTTDLTQSIQSYFNTTEQHIASTDQDQEHKQEKFSFFDYSLDIKYDSVLKDMLPELTQLEPFSIAGKYDQRTNYISVKGGISKLEYAENTINNVYWNIEPYQGALGFSLGVVSISNSFLQLRGLNLQGDMKDNMLRYSLNLSDSKDRLCYVLSGEVESKEDQIIAKLYPKGFMLDYQNWQINPLNEIVVDSSGIYISDFDLSQGNSSIKIASQEKVANSPLHIQFADFNLATLTKTIQKDKLLAGGNITGYVNLEDLSKDFRFVSDIDIKEFQMMEMPLGDLHIGVKNASLSQYLASVVLDGQNNSIALKGMADMQDSTLDMSLDISQLQMEFLAGFVPELLSEAQGYFSSNLRISGKMDDPKVLGDFKFNNIGFHVNTLNADFTDINESITFVDNAINFDRFTIKDSDGNILVVNGQVLTKNYANVGFKLDITANDFKAVNSTSKDNEMYYGTLVFDTAMKIRGDMNKPVVSGEIGVGPKTDFTIVMPQEDPSIADREGIVEFVDQQSLQNAELMKYQEDFNTSAIMGLDVSLIIKVSKSAVFSMIMDKSSGDKVVLKGQGDLVGGIDPSGKVTLSGRYEFDEGSYDLSFNMIKRKFEVQKGSSIIFAGDPTDAILDLTAIYQVNAAPIDLLSNQLSSLSPSQQNMYKQKIPFQALLMMKGQLLEPEISFDIKLKDDITSVSGDVISNTNTKLAQLRNNESEMNKQVFALLLLNHFIGENPFESSAGGLSAGAIAKQSVNRILSDQLNNLASSLISGVELNFNLESSDDFSTGSKQSRTDLNVAVSKRLFSDRLKVTVGSSFEVEGNQRQNEQSANIAGDVELEYALSQDGRYLLRVYRKNRYEVALQGQVVETGVGFVITMSYQHFKELFENSRDKKQLKKQLREQTKDEKKQQED
ncbi:translocation/assembly module TamB domain-containing protein [Myroides sp. LJL115]